MFSKFYPGFKELIDAIPNKSASRVAGMISDTQGGAREAVSFQPWKESPQEAAEIVSPLLEKSLNLIHVPRLESSL